VPAGMWQLCSTASGWRALPTGADDTRAGAYFSRAYARLCNDAAGEAQGANMPRWNAPPNHVAAAVIATLAVAGSSALACAPTPQDAAERFLSARARCDFVATWTMLGASERAGLGDVARWTQTAAAEAAENLACRGMVEAVEVSGEDGSHRQVTVRYVLAEPIVVLEFRVLHAERRFAPLVEWTRLDRLIDDARARLLQNNNWEPRGRQAMTIRAVREGEGADAQWCIDGGLATRARLLAEHDARRRAENERMAEERRQRAELEAEQRRRAQEEDAEARRRGEAALPQVTVAAVRVGDTTLRELAVWAEIVNGSRATLREVEVRVEYLDSAGQVIAQKSATPVLRILGIPPGARREHAPLPPGHRRPFGVRADDAPSTWARRVRVTVVRVEADPNFAPQDSPVPATAHQTEAGARGQLQQEQRHTRVPAPAQTLAAETLARLRRHITACWSVDAEQLGIGADVVAELRLQIDGQGIIRNVVPGPAGVPNDARPRTVYETARRALLAPQCSPLPIDAATHARLEQTTLRFSTRGLAQ
jgi:hypothetical protein